MSADILKTGLHHPRTFRAGSFGPKRFSAGRPTRTKIEKW